LAREGSGCPEDVDGGGDDAGPERGLQDEVDLSSPVISVVEDGSPILELRFADSAAMSDGVRIDHLVG